MCSPHSQALAAFWSLSSLTCILLHSHALALSSLQAAERAGASPSFTLQLLERGPEIGFMPSENLCERVVRYCAAAGDAAAVQRAWVFVRAQPKRPTANLAIAVALALRTLGQEAAAVKVLQRHAAMGGRLSPMAQKLMQPQQESMQQAQQ